MSLDLYIADEHYNCTYNLSKMWYAIYSTDKFMLPIDGQTGREALALLTGAYLNAVLGYDKLRVLEPKNNWGNYNTFIKFLHDLIVASLNHSDKVWSSGR